MSGEDILESGEAPEPLIRWLSYQQGWLDDASRFAVWLASRQVGKTLTSGGAVVKSVLKAMLEGRRERWVILSRGERQAAEAMDEAVKPMLRAAWRLYQARLSGRPTYVESTFRSDENPEIAYKALEVRLPGGSRITALPANPDTARGYSAHTWLDEFAFHQRSKEIWRACFPVISKRGLRLLITSTPNGLDNQFAKIWLGKDSRWSRHKVTIEDAVAMGLDRDIAELREAIEDEESWRQEFLCEFIDAEAAWLTYEMILGCEHQDAGDPAGYLGGPCYLGMDIARRAGGDRWVLVVLEEIGDVLWVRDLIVRQGISFAEQDAIFDEAMTRYNVVRARIDQTGMGEKPVEDAQRRWGPVRVEGVLLSGGRRLDVATALRQAMEDRLLRLPERDPVLRSDLHRVKKAISDTGATRLIAERDAGGHSDRFWAIALAVSAATSAISPAMGEPVAAGEGDYAPHRPQGLIMPERPRLIAARQRLHAARPSLFVNRRAA